MAINTVEENEMPEHYGVFTLTRTRIPAEGTGQFELAAADHHPKCRLVSAEVVALIYASAADVLAIEHEDGGDVATATASVTVGTPVAMTIAPAAGYSTTFERNEPIIMLASTQGNAANATTITAQFETVH